MHNAQARAVQPTYNGPAPAHDDVVAVLTTLRALLEFRLGLDEPARAGGLRIVRNRHSCARLASAPADLGFDLVLDLVEVGHQRGVRVAREASTSSSAPRARAESLRAGAER